MNVFRCCLVASLAFALMAFAVAPTTADVVLIAESFETYDLGDDPTNPGDGNPNDWVLTNPDDMAVITGGSPGGGSQALTYVGQPVLDRDFAAQTEYLYASMDIRFLGGFADHRLSLRADSSGSSNHGPYVRFRPLDTEGGEAGISYFDGSTFLSILPNVETNDWYRVEVEADIVNHTWDLTVTNLTDATAPVTVIGIGMWQNPNNLGNWELKPVTTGNTIDAEVDRILVTVPEPGSMSLVLAPALLLGLRRVRRFRAAQRLSR